MVHSGPGTVFIIAGRAAISIVLGKLVLERALAAMYGNPQIHAVDDVVLDCLPGREDGLRLFYADMLGLREAAAPADGRMAFRAHQRLVIVRFTPEAVGSPMRRRLVVQVDSLEDVGERLRLCGFTWRRQLGTGIGDQRLIVLDPGRNRVELKQVYLL